MLCPGLSGDLDKIHESSPELPNRSVHDGAAVLVQDHRVIAAVEDERLNCVKPSNKLPSNSIRYCLSTAGVELGEIDRIAFYATEAYCKTTLERPVVLQSVTLDAKLLLRQLLAGEFGAEIDPSRVSLVKHHEAHVATPPMPACEGAIPSDAQGVLGIGLRAGRCNTAEERTESVERTRPSRIAPL